MKALLYAGLILLLGCGKGEHEPVIPPPVVIDPPPTELSYQLTWSDEFDGTTLSPANWTFELGDGCDKGICRWGNDESQWYTDENHNVSDGILTITATKGNLINSTRIKTENKVEHQYGKIEARIKLPQGDGTWPAFWMLGFDIDTVGWPACGEIDIMEYVGRIPNKTHNAIHTTSSHGNTVNHKEIVVDDPENWHTYSIEWTSEKIDFFVDDTKTYTYNPGVKNAATWPFNKPFFLLLNFAVGGTFGGAIDNSIFPQEYQIDYVRWYQLK